MEVSSGKMAHAATAYATLPEALCFPIAFKTTADSCLDQNDARIFQTDIRLLLTNCLDYWQRIKASSEVRCVDFVASILPVHARNVRQDLDALSDLIGEVLWKHDPNF